MNLSTALAETLKVEHLDLFARTRDQIDPAWVEAALGESELPVRRRKLPADVVVWTVVGACLFSRYNFQEVVGHLGLTAPTRRGRPQAPPKSSSIAEARKRVGADVFASILRKSALAWSDERAVAQHRLSGLRVLALDGTELDVPDNAENLKAFGKRPAPEGQAPASNPQIRALVLLDVRSHLIMDAELGGIHSGELPMAEAMLPRVPDHSLVIMDRGFKSYGLIQRLRSSGVERHFLLRVPRNTVARVTKQLGPGDAMVELKFSWATRQADPALPTTTEVREVRFTVKGSAFRVLTSLPPEVPAAAIRDLYRERWEIELGFDNIKTEQRDAARVLRSRAPDGAKQEAWALFLAHNLVRLEMARAAAIARVPPTRISFHGALNLVALHLQRAATPVSPSKLAIHESLLRQQIAVLVLPERRSERVFPRALKRVCARYPKKKPHITSSIN